MYRFKYSAWITASVLTLGAAGALAQSAEVGVLAAVNRDVLGERPQEQVRQLVLREKLILDERITTSEVGGGQVMFLDQTTLTLSPNSNILLDRYVYDPNTQAGDVSVTLLKGAMRFVGGRITKTGVATIKTPSATIGIRGGIGHVSVDDQGGTNYLHIAGISSTITNGAGSIVVTREGGAVTVPPPAEGGDAADGDAPQDEQSPTDGGGQQAQSDGSTQTADNPDQQQQDQAPPGSAPQYQGVATPETIAIAFGGDGGTGTGGLQAPLTPAVVRPGVEKIAIEVSASDGASIRPPISTKGEQQEESFNQPPIDLGEPPEDEIADNNMAEDIANEIPQLLDGLEFRGEWTALAGLANGDFVPPQSGLAFQMEYSLKDSQGVVLVELPDTGDLPAPNLTTLDGEMVRGDRFIITGDEDLMLSGESTLTQLGGDATEALITIGQDNAASGAIFIDYLGSDLANTDFVDGELNNVGGTEVVGDPISTKTNILRTEFQQ